MAQHNVKIEDKLYVKLKAYCDLNKESIFKVSNDAIREFLNKIQFGDAPFMVQSVALKANEIDINGKVYTGEALEKMINEHNENLQKSQETPEKIDEKFIACVDTSEQEDYTATVEGTVDKEGNFEVTKTTVTRPKKRRL